MKGNGWHAALSGGGNKLSGASGVAETAHNGDGLSLGGEEAVLDSSTPNIDDLSGLNLNCAHISI